MKGLSLFVTQLLFGLAVCLPAPQVDSDGQSLTAELLSVLDSFPSNTPEISELATQIQQNASVIDSAAGGETTTAKRDITAQARNACSVLRILFSSSEGYVDASSNQTAYTAATLRNWSDNCDLPAACVIYPESTCQVALAIKVITYTGSKFAVRSGGHNPNPGFAGVDGSGALIDVTRLTALSLSADKKVASVGPGNVWGSVQKFLSPSGVSVIGGRNFLVGVSGLLLGGGYPNIPSAYGLACDNVKNYEVVLSDSTVVNANANENPALFKALKGGGNNFGVVTRFDLYTNTLTKLWYTSMSFNVSDYKAVLQAISQVQKNMDLDKNANILVSASQSGFSITFMYADWVSSKPVTFAPFDQLTPLAVSTPPTNITNIAFGDAMSPSQRDASRETVGATTYIDSDLYIQIFEQYLSIAHTTPSTVSFNLILNPIAKPAVDAGTARGGNSLGNAARGQAWWNPVGVWTAAADEAIVHSSLTSLISYIVSQSTAKGLYHPYIFANVASDDQNVVKSYGGSNLATMKSISQKYDRTQAFQKLQNGGWLVSKA